MKRQRLLFIVTMGFLYGLLPHPGTAQTRPDGHPEFDAGLAAFTLHVRDVECPYRILGVYLLPDDTLSVAIADSHRTGLFAFRASAGQIDSLGPFAWKWRAPHTTGLYRLSVRRVAPADSITLNVFVMVPASELKNGHLGGYRIGQYPKETYRGLSNYKPPRGFVKVTQANKTTQLSPHFRLEQFLCKQAAGFPKYVVLREELMLKLELILHEVNSRGYRCSGFNILSGFRTPYYNKSIGNVKYSRHQWGGAADIFIDEIPKDGMMDDLNGDGVSNWRDAAILYDIIDDLYGKPSYEPFIGGLGRYRKTSNHGPFVHVDVRGFRARWGD